MQRNFELARIKEEAMNTVYNILRRQVMLLIDRLKANGKLSLANAYSIVQSIVLLGYEEAERLLQDGAARKAAVMDAASRFFDVMYPMLVLPPLVARAQWVLSWFLPKGWEKQVFMFVVDRGIEGVHYILSQRKGITEQVLSLPLPASPFDVLIDIQSTRVGSGKTTTGNIIAEVLEYAGAKVAVEGFPRQQARRRFGFPLNIVIREHETV
jgi:hypothetical protein